MLGTAGWAGADDAAELGDEEDVAESLAGPAEAALGEGGSELRAGRWCAVPRAGSAMRVEPGRAVCGVELELAVPGGHAGLDLGRR